jgi:hypothetical protein
LIVAVLAAGALFGRVPTVADVQGHALPHNAARWKE